MDKEQIEAWINQWIRENATDQSGKMLCLFLAHEFQLDTNAKMKHCNGCDQPFTTFLLMPMRSYKDGTYDPSDYHLVTRPHIGFC